MTSSSLKKSVIDELDWEPSLDASEIGVEVANGVVTLVGRVKTYFDKRKSEEAAGRVKGVKGIVEKLEVASPMNEDPDEHLVERISNVLFWTVDVPHDRIAVKVEKGWVTLSGQVEWNFQRMAAVAAVRTMMGVRGVVDLTTIRPFLKAANIEAKIQSALDRHAELEGAKIKVSLSGGKVILSGAVDTWNERSIAEQAAWSAPGVIEVEDRISIG